MSRSGLTCALLADDHAQVDGSPVRARGPTVRTVPVCPIGPDLLSHLVVRQGLGYCFLQSGRPALPSPPRLGCEAEGWTASLWAWTCPLPLKSQPVGHSCRSHHRSHLDQPRPFGHHGSCSLALCTHLYPLTSHYGGPVSSVPSLPLMCSSLVSPSLVPT